MEGYIAALFFLPAESAQIPKNLIFFVLFYDLVQPSGYISNKTFLIVSTFPYSTVRMLHVD